MYYNVVFNELKNILLETRIDEFKWNKVRNDKYFECAKKIIKYILANIANYDIRIDILIWDTHDSRHSIQGRNDTKNYERMFYHLLNNSMKKRNKNMTWYIYPDKKNDIDWNTIHDVLNNTGKSKEYSETIFGKFLTDPYFKIENFEPKESHTEIPIQVADLFSGLAVFSRDNIDLYKYYNDTKQYKIFVQEQKKELSNSENYRFELLNFFVNECKNKNLGVSINNNGYLCTFKPKYPINFWHYKPQGDYDKAPTG